MWRLGERGHTRSRGASLSVPHRRRGLLRLRFAAREAELCPPASRYEALLRGGRTRERSPPRKSCEHGEATNRPRPHIERSKVLRRPSSPLQLRAACVPDALHPTKELDAPSVRKDTKPENTRVQPPQGVPRYHPHEYRASSPRCEYVR